MGKKRPPGVQFEDELLGSRRYNCAVCGLLLREKQTLATVDPSLWSRRVEITYGEVPDCIYLHKKHLVNGVLRDEDSGKLLWKSKSHPKMISGSGSQEKHDERMRLK